jgi:hypothetical protein
VGRPRIATLTLGALLLVRCTLGDGLDDLKSDSVVDAGDDANGSGGSNAAGGVESCFAGLVDCNGQLPGGCANTSSDPKHCGACNHDCLGGECREGRCQPFAIAQSPHPWDILADATHFYWTDWFGSVHRAPVSGGPIEPIAENLGMALAITQDAKAIYWTTQGSSEAVMTFPKAGGNATILTSLPKLGGIALSGSTLYFTQGNDWGAWDGTVNSLPVAGGTPTVLASGLDSPSSVATDGARLYWNAYWTGDIMSIPIDGSEEPTVHANGGSELGGPVVDATNIYWCSPKAGTIWVIPKNGTQAKELVSGQPYPQALVMHDQTLFWANGDSGEILSLAPGGTAPEVLATGQAAWSLFVDAAAIYWTDKDAGQVMRLAR